MYRELPASMKYIEVPRWPASMMTSPAEKVTCFIRRTHRAHRSGGMQRFIRQLGFLGTVDAGSLLSEETTGAAFCSDSPCLRRTSGEGGSAVAVPGDGGAPSASTSALSWSFLRPATCGYAKPQQHHEQRFAACAGVQGRRASMCVRARPHPSLLQRASRPRWLSLHHGRGWAWCALPGEQAEHVAVALKRLKHFFDAELQAVAVCDCLQPVYPLRARGRLHVDVSVLLDHHRERPHERLFGKEGAVPQHL
jgi:hypothetical protein